MSAAKTGSCALPNRAWEDWRQARHDELAAPDSWLGLLGLFIGDRKVWAGLGLVLNLACVAAIMWLAGGLAVGLAHM